MTIDTNTIVLSLLALASGYFAFGFISQKVQAKFDGISRTINEAREQNWRDTDQMMERIDELQKKVDCCMAKQVNCCKQQSSNSY